MLLAFEISNELMMVLSAVGGVMGTVIGVLFWQLMSAKDRAFDGMVKEKDQKYDSLMADKAKAVLDADNFKRSWQEIAVEASKSARETADFYLRRDGLPPVPIVAPVIARAHSPSTAEQRETALLETMRAQIAAVKLAMGQAPLAEPEHAIEPGVMAGTAPPIPAVVIPVNLPVTLVPDGKGP